MERASKTVPLGKIPVENGVVLTAFWHRFDDAIFSCPLEATGIDDRDRGIRCQPSKVQPIPIVRSPYLSRSDAVWSDLCAV